MQDFVRALGCLEDKKDIRDYKINKNLVMAFQYPESFECGKYVTVKDQGAVGSCVAHSAAEILEYHNGCKEKLSTNFIYGIHYKLFRTKGPGMYPREACKIVKEYGDPEYELCPGNDEVDKVYSIAEEAFNKESVLADAKRHKIFSYAKLGSANDIKFALMNYGPVLGTITWYDDNKVDNTTGYLTKGTISEGGHAIMVYGWNEQGWLCQNSWGRFWGNKGRFILPYSYRFNEVFSFVPSEYEGDIVKPSRNPLVDFICKIVNWVINLWQ